jgi:hypothetical protein
MSHNVRNEENLGPIAQNRRRRNKTLTRATGLGLCVAILPIPQMLTIALLAIPLRLNLPVAMSCVFVTNPLTMATAFYMNYRIGAWALQTPSWEAPDHLTMQTLAEQWDFIWLPLYTGSLLVGATVGLLGMLLADYLWRGYARREWMRRSAAR